MSFIPSKLGLRTHPLTQINLALVRVAGEKIYAQFAALLFDPNYGPTPRAGQLNNKGCVVLLLLSILVSHSKSFISVWKQCDADALALCLEVSVLGFSSYSCWPIYGPPAPSCHWFGQKTLGVPCGPRLPLFYYQRKIMWLFQWTGFRTVVPTYSTGN